MAKLISATISGWPHGKAAARAPHPEAPARPEDAGVARRRLGRRRAVRNALKVALPWDLGHTAAFLLADPKASGSTVLVGTASAALATGYVASLFLGAGRTPYDHRRQLRGPLTRSGNVRRDPVKERAVRKSLGPGSGLTILYSS